MKEMDRPRGIEEMDLSSRAQRGIWGQGDSSLHRPDPALSLGMTGNPDPHAGPALAERVTAARARLDEHVREMVAWHFDPETGCPFWLDFARRLDFDPRQAIRGYADLKLLGHFQDGWLRGGPVRRWLPRAYAGRPVYVFETGGSTG